MSEDCNVTVLFVGVFDDNGQASEVNLRDMCSQARARGIETPSFNVTEWEILTKPWAIFTALLKYFLSFISPFFSRSSYLFSICFSSTRLLFFCSFRISSHPPLFFCSPNITFFYLLSSCIMLFSAFPPSSFSLSLSIPFTPPIALSVFSSLSFFFFLFSLQNLFPLSLFLNFYPLVHTFPLLHLPFFSSPPLLFSSVICFVNHTFLSKWWEMKCYIVGG